MNYMAFNFLVLTNLLIDAGCNPHQSIMSKTGNHQLFYSLGNKRMKLEYKEEQNTVKVFKWGILTSKELACIDLNTLETVEEVIVKILEVS